MATAESQRSKAHIAFFLPDLAMGGAERVFLTLSSALARRGYKVELILARKSGPLLDEVDQDVALIDLEAYRPDEPAWRFGMRTVWRLVRHLRRNPPDTLFSTLTGANLCAIVARLLSRRKFRLIVREAAALANVKSKVRLSLMRVLYPLADRIVVLTGFMRQQMHAELRLSVDHMVIIGNPVDIEKIHLLSQDPELIQRAQEFQPYAVCVGRLSKPKDQASVIKAIARINAIRIFNLVLVGDGPLRCELKLLAEELGIESRVHFVGQQTNPYPWMAQANILVLSSHWEGYPNVLLEARGLNVPIVVTDYDASVSELLRGANNAVVVHIGRVDEMSSAIMSMGEAPNLRCVRRSELGDRSRVIDMYDDLSRELFVE